MLRERRYWNERGQVLAGALVFIGFFALVATAVLTYASVGQLQHRETEATASTDATVEAAGLFGQVDGGRSDNACVPGLRGDLTFKTGDTVRYTVGPAGCNFGIGQPGGPAVNCLLCVLNPSNASPAFDSDSNTKLAGEVDINGLADLKNGATLCSVKLMTDPCSAATGFIGVTGGTSGNGTFQPATTSLAHPVGDPLANTFVLPAGISTMGSITAGVATANAVYTSLSNAMLPAGVYVVTGKVGQGLIGTGVTLVLTCAKAASPFWQPCAGNNGGYVDLSGNDTMAISAPTSGPYANLVIFGDPTNPGAGDGKGVSLHGNGAITVNGTVYTASMTLDVQGNATAFSNGRLVVGTVKNLGGGAGLTVTGTVPTQISCNVFSDGLAVNGTSDGHVVFQTACSGGSEIVNFDYTP